MGKMVRTGARPDMVELIVLDLEGRIVGSTLILDGD
jgi:hypothetical protein